MRHPYGIWNSNRLVRRCRCRILWDIPMGFETCRKRSKLMATEIMRHPYGIWNRLWRCRVRLLSIMRHPYGIWNLNKLCENCAKKLDYETSLWDLKPGKSFEEWSNLINYETSLWDLKPSDVVCVCPHCHIMRHPYGIWNLHNGVSEKVCAKIMRHPYGIWNLCFKSGTAGGMDYETSLWDLKPGKSFEEWSNLIKIMRHPYGIWNRLWRCRVRLLSHIMRHPYGIWNT